MFIRNRKPLKAVGVALCFSCFGFSVSSAAGPSLLTSRDEARESSISGTQQGDKLAPEGTVAGSKAGPAQLLDGEELAQLAVRAEQPGEDVVGGALTNQHLTYIVIALAAAVVVLIAK